MSDTIEIPQGSCIHAQMTWTDEAGVVDLTVATLRVVEAEPSGLEQATVEIVDAPNGVSRLNIHGALAAILRPGRVNWLRLEATIGEHIHTTPKLWINVS